MNGAAALQYYIDINFNELLRNRKITRMQIKIHKFLTMKKWIMEASQAGESLHLCVDYHYSYRMKISVCMD